MLPSYEDDLSFRNSASFRPAGEMLSRLAEAGRVNLRGRDCWIFDMDGTLTVAVHDYEAIRTELGLPAGEPILESVARLPPREAATIQAELDRIELALALQAQPGAGATRLLARLSARGARLGILTRNGVDIAHETLRACGLDSFFDKEHVLGRESAPPKPHPSGIEQLLRMWGAAPERAVMVGDYYFDLVAGRAAGTSTVYVDPSGDFEFAEFADVRVRRLDALLEMLD